MNIETVSGAHIEHAVALLVRVHSGCEQTAEQARLQLEQWRCASPQHEAAFQRAYAAWAATDLQGLKDDIPMPVGRRDKVRGRRRVVQALTLGALAVMGGACLRPSGRGELVLATVRAQVLQRTLTDGSILSMAPLSRIRWMPDGTQRLMELAQGEIHLDVAKDPGRPFRVRADWGEIHVLGTAFTVERTADGMTVTVEHGQVQLRPAQGGDVLVLTAGQRARIDASGMQAREFQDVAQLAAWRGGWLVFDHSSLEQVIAVWNRYLAQPFSLDADPALSRHRVTGRFQARDPAAFLLALPQILPVQIRAQSQGGWLIFSAQ